MDKTTNPNITYTQAGGSCLVRKKGCKFKIQFFIGSSVLITPTACRCLCKLPRKEYILKVDKMFNFKMNQYEKEHF